MSDLWRAWVWRIDVVPPRLVHEWSPMQMNVDTIVSAWDGLKDCVLLGDIDLGLVVIINGRTEALIFRKDGA